MQQIQDAKKLIRKTNKLENIVAEKLKFEKYNPLLIPEVKKK